MDGTESGGDDRDTGGDDGTITQKTPPPPLNSPPRSGPETSPRSSEVSSPRPNQEASQTQGQGQTASPKPSQESSPRHSQEASPRSSHDPDPHTLELIAKYIGGSPTDEVEELSIPEDIDTLQKEDSSYNLKISDAKSEKQPEDGADMPEDYHDKLKDSFEDSGNNPEDSRGNLEESVHMVQADSVAKPPEHMDNGTEQLEEDQNKLVQDSKDGGQASRGESDLTSKEEDEDDKLDVTDPSGAAAGSFSSPETKVSGVMSDPGDSFGSPQGDTGKESEDDTDEEDNEVARSLVKEVLSKAMMGNSESDEDAGSADAARPNEFGDNSSNNDGDRGTSDATHSEGINIHKDPPKPANEVQKSHSPRDIREERETGHSESDPRVEIAERDADESNPEAERIIEVQAQEDEEEEDLAEGEDEVKLMCIGEGSPHPEYPLNYGNYKVCRKVAPGVKECLILETGEFVKYDRKKTISTGSLSPTTSPRKLDDSPQRSLSESSGGSPRSDTDGERKAFKIVKTSPATKESGFSSLKLGDNGEELTSADPAGADVNNGEDVESFRRETSGDGDEDGQECSGAEAEQVSDVLESPEEVARVQGRQENQETRSILKKREESEESMSNSANTAPVSPGKPPMSPRTNKTYERNDRGLRSPPRRATDGGRNFDNIDQSRGSNTSDYGGSMNGSYISGRPPGMDRVYQSMPDLVDPKLVYQPEVMTSPPSSGPVPGYNTMQDQQISWLKMFKLLEDEHRTELRSQYAEHQRLIQDIQGHMEKELRKQQASIQARLDSHREILHDVSSPRADRVLSSLSSNDYKSSHRRPVSESYRGRLVADYSSGDSAEGDREEVTFKSSRSRSTEHLQTATHRSPISEKRVPSYHMNEEEEFVGRTSTSFPVRRSLERDFESPVRSPERSYLSRSRSDVGGDRLLRGGVYSSPMPISKAKSSNRSSTSISRQSLSESQLPSPPPLHHDVSVVSEQPFEVRPRRDLSWREDSHLLTSDSFHDDSQLSMSTRVNLREKHAKHLSDLRGYYEAELAELRTALSAAQPPTESAHERILRDENHSLKHRCQDLSDELHDSRVHVRDLEQKLQGLEIRANDYSARYDESQRSVLVLRGQLDDLHLNVKDKDGLCTDLQAKVKQQTKVLQDAFKYQNDLTENCRRDKEAMKRLLEKYENLEKEHDITTGRVGDGDRKLRSAHDQIADLNKTIAKLELHNKQLARENETLKHKAAIAMNMVSTKTSYEDSYGSFLDSPWSSSPTRQVEKTSRQGETTARRSNVMQYQSHERLYTSEPEGKRRVESSQESDDESDTQTPSPLLKAEQELHRLQKASRGTLGYEPRVQKKYYGSEVAYPGRYRESSESEQSQPRNTSSAKTSSPKSKSQIRNLSRSDTQLNSVGTQNGVHSPKRPGQSRIRLKPKEMSTPTRFDVNLNDISSSGESSEPFEKEEVVFSPRQGVSQSSTNKGTSVEKTLSSVRAGTYTTRPEWEDIVTSMAQPKKSQTSPRQNMTREDRLKERLQVVDKMERRYDDLQAEKRKLESALNKIPTHGRNRKMIQTQEQIETDLEKVDKEIGSVRMSLKRFQVLKSTI